MRCIGFFKWFGFMLLLDLMGFHECSSSRRCRFSNEGCKEDDDCCSGSCERSHSGADLRCSKSEMLFPCYADYMCDDSLKCGRLYKCCSPYWGLCNSEEECCDPDHSCIYHSEFAYKRCLYPSSSGMFIWYNPIIIFVTCIIKICIM